LTVVAPNRYGDGVTAIAIGADHAGFALKESVKRWLLSEGHTVVDFGTCSTAPVDYPDYAAPVGDAVSAGAADRGVLVCGSGIGMAMAANKIAGVRAAVCGDVAGACICREHNDANVLALGARTTQYGQAVAIVSAWLRTPFAGGRHARRVEKMMELEQRDVSRAAAD
jgi:ribose 5-phosphate isomerase B